MHTKAAVGYTQLRTRTVECARITQHAAAVFSRSSRQRALTHSPIPTVQVTRVGCIRLAPETLVVLATAVGGALMHPTFSCTHCPPRQASASEENVLDGRIMSEAELRERLPALITRTLKMTSEGDRRFSKNDRNDGSLTV